MCIRDRLSEALGNNAVGLIHGQMPPAERDAVMARFLSGTAVSYTHLRAHETVLDLVCRLLLEKKKHNTVGNGRSQDCTWTYNTTARGRTDTITTLAHINTP